MGKISYPDGGAITGTTPPDITTTTGSSPGDSGTTTSVTVPDDGSLAEINVNETESADWINFYKSALNSMGNTSRLVEKMSLAKAGEPIKVGFIGGSFTVGDTIAGDSYAVQVYKYFENTFGTGSNISYVNAGLSGTNSTTALMRSDLDLFSQSPDVIFIEFAVNDDGSNPDCKAAFDALVAKAISQPNNPAVIIQINRPGYPVGGTQEYMVQSAAKYDVPVISINDAINIGCPSNDYISGDNIHPTANGHTIIAKTVQYFFREVIRTRSEYAVVSPKNVAIPGLAGATLKTSADLTNFSSTMDRVFDYFYNSHFPENFGGNGNISFTTQGKGVIVAYKGSDAGQTFTVTVNGKTVTGKSSNNWGGAESIIAFNSETTQELNVTITSGNITILGISISG
jgi:lysophospholipase L1-like esterase